MSDHELRLAERAFQAAISYDEHSRTLAALQRARARHGQPPLCEECFESDADALASKIIPPSCVPCVESSLRYGHEHVGHDDLVGEDGEAVAKLCPLCRRDADRHDSGTCPLECCIRETRS